MIRRSYQQYAIVAADSAQTLSDQLNKKLIELRDKNPTVTFEGLIARIQYTVNEDLPETLAEEYEAKGVRLTCQDCPFFVPTYKADGTEDLRCKRGGCPWTEYGTTCRSSMACDKLFEMLNNGEVTICLKNTR